MIVDEQWDRHVATAGYYGDNGSGYNCNGYGFFASNIIGIYHGAPVASEFHEFDYDYTGYPPFLWKQGAVGFYDGHAGLQRDPWPTYELGEGVSQRRRSSSGAFRTQGLGKSGFDEINAIQHYRSILSCGMRDCRIHGTSDC